MARWRLIAAATLLALASINACGGGSDGAETPTGSGSGSELRETDTGTGNPGKNQITYMPWGPDDPPIPTQYAALAASGSSAPRCENLADVRPDGAFWEMALAVCRAISEDGDWPDTTAVPAPPPAVNGYQACLNTELAAMLERALRWHEDHPGQRPEVVYPSDSSTSPCQAEIYEVRVLSEADFDLEGSPPEGVPLAIIFSDTGQDHLPVTVDGQAVEDVTGDFNVDEPEGDGMATLVVLAPADDQSRTARIEVSTHRGPLTARVDLPGSGSSPQPETSDATSSGDTGGTTESSLTEPSEAASPESPPTAEPTP